MASHTFSNIGCSETLHSRNLLQVDVIESQFSTFMEKITSTRDFEAVKLAHDQFLSALLSQSFVHMKAVSIVVVMCNSIIGPH